MRPSASINAGVSGGDVIAPSHPYNPSKTRPSSFLFHKTTGHGLNLKIGLQFGVAKKANLIAVKVLSDTGHVSFFFYWTLSFF